MFVICTTPICTRMHLISRKSVQDRHPAQVETRVSSLGDVLRSSASLTAICNTLYANRKTHSDPVITRRARVRSTCEISRSPASPLLSFCIIRRCICCFSLHGHSLSGSLKCNMELHVICRLSAKKHHPVKHRSAFIHVDESGPMFNGVMRL